MFMDQVVLMEPVAMESVMELVTQVVTQAALLTEVPVATESAMESDMEAVMVAASLMVVLEATESVMKSVMQAVLRMVVLEESEEELVMAVAFRDQLPKPVHKQAP